MPSRLGAAAVDLEHGPHRELAGDGVGRQRHGVGMDVLDRAVARDEHHVERDQRVLHPEADRRLLVEVEQHAVIGAELLAVHQSARALGVVQRQLDVELDLARARHDDQRRLLERDLGALRQCARRPSATNGRGEQNRRAAEPRSGTDECHGHGITGARPISSNSRHLRDSPRLSIVPAVHRGEPHPRLRGSQERPRQPDPVSTGVGTGDLLVGCSSPSRA